MGVRCRHTTGSKLLLCARYGRILHPAGPNELNCEHNLRLPLVVHDDCHVAGAHQAPLLNQRISGSRRQSWYGKEVKRKCECGWVLDDDQESGSTKMTRRALRKDKDYHNERISTKATTTMNENGRKDANPRCRATQRMSEQRTDMPLRRLLSANELAQMRGRAVRVDLEVLNVLVWGCGCGVRSAGEKERNAA